MIDIRHTLELAELNLEKQMKSTDTHDKALTAVIDELNRVRGERFKLEITTRIQVKQILGDNVMERMKDPGIHDKLNHPTRNRVKK